MTRPHPAVVVLTAAYLALVGLITLLPADSTAQGGPLLWLAQRLAGSPVTAWLTFERMEFAANVIMFTPFGVLFVIMLGLRRWWLVLIMAALTTVAIETAQLWIPNRVSDVRDLVANTAGAALGVAAVLIIVGVRQRR